MSKDRCTFNERIDSIGEERMRDVSYFPSVHVLAVSMLQPLELRVALNFIFRSF